MIQFFFDNKAIISVLQLQHKPLSCIFPQLNFTNILAAFNSKILMQRCV